MNVKCKMNSTKETQTIVSSFIKFATKKGSESSLKYFITKELLCASSFINKGALFQFTVNHKQTVSFTLN